MIASRMPLPRLPRLLVAVLGIAALGVLPGQVALATPHPATVHMSRAHGEGWYKRQVKKAERKVRRCQMKAAYRKLYPLRRWKGWREASYLRFGFDWSLAVSAYLTHHQKVARWYAHRGAWRDPGEHRLTDSIVLYFIDRGRRSPRYIATFIPGCR